MKMGICAIFKNEGRYLREWVEYHRLIGFDGFVLYDNGSGDRGAIALAKPHLRAAVSVVWWPIQPGQQWAYRHFAINFAQQFDWVAFIDIDEFVHPLGGDDIRSCLEVAGTHSAILMHWLNFGPGAHTHRPSGSVTGLYDLRLPESDPWHRHVKSLVRVSDLLDCDDPHVAQLRGPPCNTRGETVGNDPIQTQICHANLVINHYYTKSQEDWQEKMQRGRATTLDPVVQRNQAQFDYCRSYGTVSDHRIQRFLPRLRTVLSDTAPGIPPVPGPK